jgi:hypothetical protein
MASRLGPSYVSHVKHSEYCRPHLKAEDYWSNVGEHRRAQQAVGAESSNQGKFTLGSSFQKYNGLPEEDLRLWIMAVDFELQFYSEWNNQQQLSAAVKLLGGAALRWFLENHNAAVQHVPGYQEIRTWVNLKTGLIRQFQPEQQRTTLRRQLDQLKQGPKTVLEYANQFHGIVGQLPNMNEEDKVHRFATGLRNQRASDEIAIRGISTITEAIRVASLFDIVRQPTKKYYQQDRVTPTKDQDGPTPMELDRAERRDITCYQCGGKNHLAKHCLAPPSDKENRRFDKPKRKPRNQSRNGSSRRTFRLELVPEDEKRHTSDDDARPILDESEKGDDQ